MRAMAHAHARRLLSACALWPPVHRCFDVLAEWRKVAVDVQGEALDCGHYLAEERPGDVAERLLAFF